ncbi:MAG: M14 family metallopeptidase [Phycisphaerales bacterium]
MRLPINAISMIGLAALVSSSALAQSDGYMDNAELSQTIDTISNASEMAWSSTIGKSLDGTPIRLLTLSGSPQSADDHPAILITAGIDGRYLVGTEMATIVAHSILADHSELLDSMTVYIIARVNPDGAERNLHVLTMGYQGNSRSTDDDRDRLMGEDGPDDLNGDGLITMMRRLNPPIENPPTHLADPDDPRLNINPDATEGQRASFILYTEGIDNDGDGQINEDGFGSVDLDQNFMHNWPEHATHSGRYPLSEPESKAIADFVIGHPNIVMAYTLGRYDNLVNSPDSKGKNITGRAPKGIDAKDAQMYTLASKFYKEATGQKYAPIEKDAGSFHSWLYAQRGIPSFASVVWTRPELDKADGKDQDDESTDSLETQGESSSLTPSGIGDISQETIDELIAAYQAETGEEVDQSMMAMVTPEMIVGFAAQAGVEVQRVPADEPEQESAPNDDKHKKKKKKKSEDAKWLEYFEQAGIDGFVEWEPYEHPTLGAVEIGGFVPLARINPPIDQLDELAVKQTDFVIRLMEAKAHVTIAGPEVTPLADELYEIRIAIVNDGEMPTSTMYSQTTHTLRPIVIRLSSEVDNIITGQRISRVWGIDANGGRSQHHWIIRSDDIQHETIEIIDPRFGNQTIHLGDDS